MIKRVKRLFTSVKVFSEKSKQYIQNNKQEIAHENWSLLRKMSILYTIILMIAVVVFHTITDWNQYALYVLIGACMQILFTSYVFVLDGDWKNRYYFVQIVIEVFAFIIAAMTICASVFSYSNYVGLFFPSVLICLGVLYIYPYAWILTRITIYEVAYVILSFYFKDTNTFYLDLTSSICAYTIVVIASYSIFTLRIKDHTSKSELKKLSATDLLTSLSNKITAEYLCETYIKDYGKTQSCALLVLDIDNFKGINDKLGHQCGDEVLRQVGKILSDSFRSNDIVGRIGGDEFLVLMKNTADYNIIRQKAEKTIMAIRNISVEDSSTRITCSIGIDISNCNCMNFQQMFAKADKALYNAKANGRDRFTFFTENENNNDDDKDMLPYVLVADDAEISRVILRNIFKEKYNVLEAKDGKEAIDLANKYADKIKVVILDIEMPKLDGYQVLGMMKQDEFLKDIPVFFITAYTIDPEKAKQLGAIDVIAKPFRVDNILNQLKDVL